MTHPCIIEIVKIRKQLHGFSVAGSPDDPRFGELIAAQKQWYLDNPKIKPKYINQIVALDKLRELSDYTIDWVAPDWEPITKIDEPWRCLYMFVLAMLAILHDIAGLRLGVLTVSWSECAPERAFLIYDETVYSYDRDTEKVVKK